MEDSVKNNIALNEITVKILTELDITSFNELLIRAGSIDTLQILKPCMYRMANNSILIAKQGGNLKGDGPEAVGTMFLLGHSAVCGPESTDIEVKEKGIIVTTHDCPFKNAPTELCGIVSHIMGDAFCDILAKDHEMIWAYHLTEGDPYCLAVIKKKGEPFSDINALGKTIATFPKVNLPKEQQLQIAAFLISNYWSSITEVFVEKYGSDKAIEVLGSNAGQIGRGAGAYLMQSGMVKQKDLTSAAQLIDTFGRGSMQQGNVVSSSSMQYSKEIVECPFKTMPKEVCKQFESFFNGVCQAVNPNLQFKYSKMMTAGDQSCLWSVTKK